MTAQILCLPNAINFWLVVADRQKADFYAYSKVLKLTPIALPESRYVFKESMEDRLSSLSELSLKAGTADKNGLQTELNQESLHTEQELQRQFVTTIAQKLDELCDSDCHIRLVLALPPRMLGELKACLAEETLAHVAALVPKELTGCGERELLPHIQYVLPRVMSWNGSSRKTLAG